MEEFKAIVTALLAFFIPGFMSGFCFAEIRRLKRETEEFRATNTGNPPETPDGFRLLSWRGENAVVTKLQPMPWVDDP